MSCQAILNVTEREPKIKLDDPAALHVYGIIGDIKLDHVSFSYKSRNEKVLDDLTMTFEKGKMTALVGISGSGKSTVAKLLQRIYDPSWGSINVNGEDLRSLNLRQYRH